jgi:predicted dehydrogenase
MLKIGIIGGGKIATLRHIPEYAENPQTTLTAFTDMVPERAREAAAPYHGKVYNTPEDLLADPDIDAVSICSANATHAPLTIAALEAGKHVLCEKPMATSLEDCEAMVRAAERAGRLLMLGHNQRYVESNRIARELVEKGEIGDILSFQSCFGHKGPEHWTGDKNPWFFHKELAHFGAVADLGIHKVDLIHYLTGQHTQSVTAVVETLHKTFPDGSPITVDDNAMCMLRLSGGAVGTVRASWTIYGREDNATRLYGTDGVLRIDDDPEYALVLEKKTGEVFRYALEGMATNAQQLAGRRKGTGVIDAFVTAIGTGVPPLSDGRQAVLAMRAIFGAMKAAASGTWVQV